MLLAVSPPEAIDYALVTVQVLVEAGASLSHRDTMFDGTPLGWAKHFGYTEIIEYLEHAGRGSDGVIPNAT